MKKTHNAFTLIELVVSITILAIVMVSIFAIFALSADLNNKTDISRAMQENVKNIVEVISEDVRKLKITGVNESGGNCGFDASTTFTSGDMLCLENTKTGDQHKYYLGKKDATDAVTRVHSSAECTDLQPCFLVFHDNDWPTKLSNDWVQFTGLRFDVTGNGTDGELGKVVVRFQLQPSVHKGVKPQLVEETKLIFQTTLSGRIYKDY